jgi:hypothetical protein
MSAPPKPKAFPPGPPGNVTDKAVLITIPTLFYIAAMILYGMRIHTRYKLKNLARDDAMMTLGVVFATGFFATTFVSIAYGLGQHAATVPKSNIVPYAKATFLALPEVYGVAIAAVRLSIGLMLLRIKGDRPAWRWSLWSIMLFIIAIFVTNVSITFTQCRPLSAIWTFNYKHAKCLPPHAVHGVYTAFNVIYLFVDLAYALLPALFIRKLNQPLRDRIVLSMLMAMGLLCTVCNIPRLILIVRQGNFSDFTYNGAGTVFWCALELYVAMCAASIPILRNKLEAGLRLLGFSLSSRGTKSSKWSGAGRFGFSKQYEAGKAGSGPGGKGSAGGGISVPNKVYVGGEKSGSNGSDLELSLLDESKGDMSWLDVEAQETRQQGRGTGRNGILKTDTVDVRMEGYRR